MKLHRCETALFQQPLITGFIRKGLHVALTTREGLTALGEAAPLPGWSKESLDDVAEQVKKTAPKLMEIEWTKENLFPALLELHLLPSLEFALESALLTHLYRPLVKNSHLIDADRDADFGYLSEGHIHANISEDKYPKDARKMYPGNGKFQLEAGINPIAPSKPLESALLMGTPAEILRQADVREQEGYRSAKLKVSGIPSTEAHQLVDQLKDRFRLRIDVNRAWDRQEALSFFERYPHDTFDYVEEPFKNPHDLHLFSHPLAIDESFPDPLDLPKLAKLPTLKAIVFKPTLQGGIGRAFSLKRWCDTHHISLVLSSAFESSLGLDHIRAMAQRLCLDAPLGLGTFHFLQN